MLRKIFLITFIMVIFVSILSSCDMIEGLLPSNDPGDSKVDNSSGEEFDDQKDELPEEKDDNEPIAVPEPDDTYPKIEYDGSHETVTVSLSLDENCAVIGPSTVTVTKGADARFAIVFKDFYTFSSVDNDNASYESGYITVKNCNENINVSVYSVLNLELCSFEMADTDIALGTVSLSQSPGTVRKYTEITVKASPASNQTFIGWSTGGTMVDGGSVVSYSATYSFKITKDVKLYANFLTEGYTVIRYDLNGGTTKDGSASVILTQFTNTNHLSPNLIADNGEIVRDGYTLLEYTENPDGSGTAINPGGMAKLPKNSKVVTYYAQWSKWNPKEHFTYTLNNTTKEATITSFNADTATVSIPMNIDGYTVTSIAANAFNGKAFDTLVIPRTLVKIENGAFNNCYNFDYLYITDTFTSIKDGAFVNCKAFSHLMLNASRTPHFVNHAESIGARLELILNRDESKNIIMFVGGSSCLHGIRSPIIEAAFDYKYQIINCGTNAGGTGVLYMEALSYFMSDGDTIVNVPEYGANQMGGTEIVWRTFRAMTSCYNLFRYVDFSQYTKFFSALSEYNTSSEAYDAGANQSYDTKMTSLTKEHCDLSGTRAAKNTKWNTNYVNSGTLNDSRIAVINNLYSKLSAKNINYYLSCAPVCYYNTSNTPSSSTDLENYYIKANTYLSCTVISHPKNYLYDSMDYYNSNYHLGTPEAELHTRKIIEDLKAVIS